MPNSADMLWFKTQFHARVQPVLVGTPLTLDFITALACQETGEIWPILRKKALSEAQILALCVGDTIDASGGRVAFPKDKADLLAQPNGAYMFDIARQALLDMAKYISAYAAAAAKPYKFCHGFGMFQRDLQFFRDDPQYFLQRRYEQFDETLGYCMGELKRCLKKLGWQHQATLTPVEMAAVGIVYNTGKYVASKGLKQGYFDGVKYYGEALHDLIQLARTVAIPAS
jgi:hypothetical protein